MTTTFKGIEPPLPTGSLSFRPPQPPARVASHALQLPPRSWPRKNSTPTPSSTDSSEPPLKKLKLEDAASSQTRGATAVRTPRSTNTLAQPASSDRASNAEQNRKQSLVDPHPVFPLRPGARKAAGAVYRNRPLALDRAAKKDVVLVKAYVPESPYCAPRYHKAGSADFFPWTGRHPEDVLNELTTRHGFCDNVQTPQSESSTGRPSIWSSLKHKSGTQILSSLFVSALDQRQAYGAIITSSTFKPPPRVTLTDTKREAWLRDLANALVPLRRLSRTIPHGVRGRVLLDHCLSKDIPTSRAIWLAKCVGANEIRAFKRKGTGGVFTVGGEAKWIKDWTSNIEHFLESIIALCGSSEWKVKIRYGLRLASHLYSEHLLDQDHYLDWLVASIENSDLDGLPLWLLVQQVHQQQILQYLQRGRRFASAILEHLYNASSCEHREVYDSVFQQVLRLSKSIISFAPACLLLPNSWNKYRATLEYHCAVQENGHLLGSFESLSRRNACLQDRASHQERYLGKSLRQRLVALLDTLSIRPDYGKIADRCLRTSKDGNTLVWTCVEWSSTIYRYGLFRTYAAARLLRIWSCHGIDLQGSLSDFLASDRGYEGLNRESLYMLIAVLVSSKHLSVGRYLQWLMARGTLNRNVNHGPDCPIDVGLLVELPLHGLPSSVLNLRQTLISSVMQKSADRERKLIMNTKLQISEQIPHFFSPINHSRDTSEPMYDLATLSRTVKSDVARWVRQNVKMRLLGNGQVKDLERGEQRVKRLDSSSTSMVSLDQFAGIRRVMEELKDYDILADVLELISNRAPCPLLTAVADTANFYFDLFYAIGAADDLFRTLLHGVDFEQNDGAERAFLESLVDLGCRLPNADQEVRRLRKKIASQAPKLAAAAVCSPISDTMVEAVQDVQPTFADEMDQILLSGTSLDKQTLTRVFGTLVLHLEKSFDEAGQLVVRFSQLLATLRDFGPKAFDVLLNEWLPNWLHSNASKNPFHLLAPLICLKVVSLRDVLSAIIKATDAESNQQPDASLALNTFDFIAGTLSDGMIAVHYRGYRVFDQLQTLMRTTPVAILAIIRRVAEACRGREPSTQIRAESQIRSQVFLNIVQAFLLCQPESTSDTDSSIKDFGIESDLQKLIGTTHNLGQWSHAMHPGFREDSTSILDDVNDFNVSLSGFRLRTALASATTLAQDTIYALSNIIIERVTTSSDDGVLLWARVVSQLTAQQASLIREQAESKVLAWVYRHADLAFAGGSKQVTNLICIIEVCALYTPITEPSPLVERIANTLSEIIAGVQAPALQHRIQTESDAIYERIDVFLRLLIIHQSAIQQPQFSPKIFLSLITALGLLLVYPLLASHPTFPHRIFDILCLLSSSMSDETRSRCIRIFRDDHHVRDPRLRFIFGEPDVIKSDWLQLVTKHSSATASRPGGAAATTSKPFPLRRWEMMQDATPVAGENDASLSLTLFGSRKSVL